MVESTELRSIEEQVVDNHWPIPPGGERERVSERGRERGREGGREGEG